MATITFETTSLEDKILTTVTTDVVEYARNAVQVRAGLALRDAKTEAAQMYLDAGVQMPTTEDALIQDMLDRGWLLAVTDATPEE